MNPIDPNYLRRLAGLPLNESITEDPAINDLITQSLADLPASEQSKYLDALETLQNAGKAGLTGGEWMAAYRQLRGQDPAAKDVLTTCARFFMGQVIRKVGLKYIWDVENVAYEDDEEPTPLEQAVSGHVDITYELISYAKQMGTVTVKNLARVITNRTGMTDPTMSQQMALQFLDSQRGNFRAIGNDTYEYEDGDRRTGPAGQKVNYSQMFKDMAASAKPGMDD